MRPDRIERIPVGDEMGQTMPTVPELFTPRRPPRVRDVLIWAAVTPIVLAALLVDRLTRGALERVVVRWRHR